MNYSSENISINNNRYRPCIHSIYLIPKTLGAGPVRLIYDLSRMTDFIDHCHSACLFSGKPQSALTVKCGLSKQTFRMHFFIFLWTCQCNFLGELITMGFTIGFAGYHSDQLTDLWSANVFILKYQQKEEIPYLLYMDDILIYGAKETY